MSRAIAVRSQQALKPEALDDPVSRAAKGLTSVLEVWEAFSPKVQQYLVDFRADYDLAEKESEGDRAVKLATILERLSRAITSLVKATDEAARLREFLGGGPDSRVDLTNASDDELIETMIEVALARGLWKVIAKRAREAGYSAEG